MNGGVRTFITYVLPFIVSLDRAGARKQTIGRREKPSTLIYHHNSFRQTDTACKQGKMGMVMYFSGINRLCLGICIIFACQIGIMSSIQ